MHAMWGILRLALIIGVPAIVPVVAGAQSDPFGPDPARSGDASASKTFESNPFGLEEEPQPGLPVQLPGGQRPAGPDVAAPATKTLEATPTGAAEAAGSFKPVPVYRIAAGANEDRIRQALDGEMAVEFVERAALRRRGLCKRHGEDSDHLRPTRAG